MTIKALRGRAGTLSREEYLQAVCAGSYPEPLTRTGRRRNAWFDNYVKRIMTRDAQDLSRLAHLDRLPDLLETLYLIHTLPAWGENLTKRVTGRPKVALLDTGFAARLNRDKLKARFAMSVVLYTGKQPLPFGERLWALPYSALWS